MSEVRCISEAWIIERQLVREEPYTACGACKCRYIEYVDVSCISNNDRARIQIEVCL